MHFNHLCLIYQTRYMGLLTEEKEQELWSQVASTLIPHMGKGFHHFSPTATAWGCPIPSQYGLVSGAKDPKAFVFCFLEALATQKASIAFHSTSLQDNPPSVSATEMDGNVAFVVKLDGTKPYALSDIMWHIGLMEGKLVPDAGVYFPNERETFCDEAMQSKILANLKDYTLCMVNVYAKEDDQ